MNASSVMKKTTAKNEMMMTVEQHKNGEKQREKQRETMSIEQRCQKNNAPRQCCIKHKERYMPSNHDSMGIP
jgi:hypothetical protein